MTEIRHRHTGFVLVSHDGNLRKAIGDAIKRGVDLREADLQGCDLSDIVLHGADLRDCDLRWADLHGASLRDCDLRGALLDGACLECADLRGVKTRRRTEFRDANISCALLRDENEKGA